MLCLKLCNRSYFGVNCRINTSNYVRLEVIPNQISQYMDFAIEFIYATTLSIGNIFNWRVLSYQMILCNPLLLLYLHDSYHIIHIQARPISRLE